MGDLKSLKTKILDKILKQLDEKIDLLTIDIAQTMESRNNDTKSSAGDKFETGREMMQIELNKNEAQLNITRKLKHDLLKIDIKCTYLKVEFGSLVKTNFGVYFISHPLGKVTTDAAEAYCISLASPIGKTMFEKQIGDIFLFQNKEYLIEDIV